MAHTQPSQSLNLLSFVKPETGHDHMPVEVTFIYLLTQSSVIGIRSQAIRRIVAYGLEVLYQFQELRHVMCPGASFRLTDSPGCFLSSFPDI